MLQYSSDLAGYGLIEQIETKTRELALRNVIIGATLPKT
jgi:hypothetical protein